jgi:hypothetical protein
MVCIRFVKARAPERTKAVHWQNKDGANKAQHCFDKQRDSRGSWPAQQADFQGVTR